MDTLKSLVEHCIRRIKPICADKIQKRKKKMAKITGISALTAGVILLSISFFDVNVRENGIGVTLLLCSMISVPLFVWSCIEFLGGVEDYDKLMNYDDNFIGVREVIYKYAGEEDTLTPGETQVLLNLDFSEKNIGILHSAISTGGYLIFDELLDIYEQQQKENEAVENQAKFIDNGVFNTVKQQNNLAQIAAINGLKKNYKTFNSKSVL